MRALDALLAVLRDPDERDVRLAEGRDALLAALPEPEVREALLAVVRGSVFLVLARRDVSGVLLVAILLLSLREARDRASILNRTCVGLDLVEHVFVNHESSRVTPRRQLPDRGLSRSLTPVRRWGRHPLALGQAGTPGPPAPSPSASAGNVRAIQAAGSRSSSSVGSASGPEKT